MSYTQINLLGQTEEFKKGFLAAVDFFDGADTYQTIHIDANSVTVELDDAQDNATYTIKSDRVKFYSTGVEL